MRCVIVGGGVIDASIAWHLARDGPLLQQMEKAKEGRPTENLSGQPTGFSQPTLTDLSISRDQSSQWQKLADVPEAPFEAALRG